jgi:hypothetical protein
MNGSFKVTLSTPFGRKSGVVEFSENNGALSGSLRALGSINPFTGGKVTGNRFEYSSSFKFGFSKVEYTARGTVDGDQLTAEATTPYGVFNISGTRVS